MGAVRSGAAPITHPTRKGHTHMTRYTQLRHAGYYQDGLTDADRQKIADKVDGKPDPKPKAAKTAAKK